MTAAVIAIVAVGAATYFGRSRNAPVERRVTSLMLDGPVPFQSVTGNRSVVVSPDAKNIVYVSGTPPRLRLRKLSESESTVIAGTEDASAPSFSPDGCWIAFNSNHRQLMRVPITGGAPQLICDVNLYQGGTWIGGDKVVLSRDPGLVSVPVTGGAPTVLWKRPNGIIGAYLITTLPGNRALIGLGRAPRFDPSATTIALLDLTTGKTTELLQATGAVYSSTGHILFVRHRIPTVSETIYAVPFDVKHGQLAGPAFPVLTGVQAFENGAIWTVATDGTIVYLPYDSASAERDLTWIANDGQTVSAGAPLGNYSAVALSPSGNRVAFTDLAHICIYDLSRDVLTELPGDDFKADVPLWSPDGRFIAYAGINSANGLYVVAADGSVPPRLLLRSDAQPWPYSWSSDGKTIAFSMQKAPGKERDIWMVDVASGTTTPFVQTPSYETSPSFSPDGRWIAYTSYTVSTSVAAIHVARYPAGNHDQTIGTAECPTECYAIVPRWSRNGDELFFRSGTKMMGVDVDTRGEEFKAAKPRALIETDISDFDVTPDGRFIGLRANRAPRWDHVNMVSGWWGGSGTSNP